MEKEFIPYAQALALKELGFDEPCVVYIYTGDTGNNVDHIIETKPSLAKNYNLYSLCISKPTFSQAFRWFREKYSLHPHICYLDEFKVWHFDIYKLSHGLWIKPELRQKETYEEVQLECLKKLIEITSGL